MRAVQYAICNAGRRAAYAMQGGRRGKYAILQYAMQAGRRQPFHTLTTVQPLAASMYNVQCCSQNLLGVHNVHMGH